MIKWMFPSLFQLNPILDKQYYNPILGKIKCLFLRNTLTLRLLPERKIRERYPAAKQLAAGYTLSIHKLQ